MRFLHLSDLHLGKRVNGFSMLEDQKYILEQILVIAQKEQAEGVLIAGDIYDKPVPSREAVQMFDWFLTRLAKMEKKVFAISGNHDSAERIAFGAQLMNQRGVFLSPVYNGRIAPVRLEDEHGELCVYLMPFLKPATVRHAFEAEGALAEGLPESYEKAVEFAIARLAIDFSKRNILVAHQFVTGAARCESEEVTVGGLDNIAAEVFDAFDYVALGHIHSPQHIKRETIRYCGTPLKYSFSEAEQEKSVTLVECGKKGEVHVVSIPLHPLRDMRKIKGAYLEVMARPFYEKLDATDYVQITLTDEEDIPDGMQKLRAVYPNLMRLLYENARTKREQEIEIVPDVEKKSEQELFMEFYELQNNRPMGKEQKEFVEQLIEELKEQ